MLVIKKLLYIFIYIVLKLLLLAVSAAIGMLLALSMSLSSLIEKMFYALATLSGFLILIGMIVPTITNVWIYVFYTILFILLALLFEYLPICLNLSMEYIGEAIYKLSLKINKIKEEV